MEFQSTIWVSAPNWWPTVASHPHQTHIPIHITLQACIWRVSPQWLLKWRHNTRHRPRVTLWSALHFVCRSHHRYGNQCLSLWKDRHVFNCSDLLTECEPKPKRQSNESIPSAFKRKYTAIESVVIRSHSNGKPSDGHIREHESKLVKHRDVVIEFDFAASLRNFTEYFEFESSDGLRSKRSAESR